MDRARLLAAHDLALQERIGVLPADPPRTDWCGYIMRRKGWTRGPRPRRPQFDSWTAYAPTPTEAIEAVWAAYQASQAAPSGEQQ